MPTSRNAFTVAQAEALAIRAAAYTAEVAHAAAEALEELDTAKQGKLTFDSAPTQNSTNPVTSGGLWTELEALKSSVSSGKALVAAAVTDMGVPTAANASYHTIADHVRAIGSADALAIYVEAPHGATISAVGTAGQTVYSGTETHNEHFVIPVPSEDSYTVTCVYGAYTLTHTIVVTLPRTTFASYVENETLHLLDTSSVSGETLNSAGTVTNETLNV